MKRQDRIGIGQDVDQRIMMMMMMMSVESMG